MVSEEIGILNIDTDMIKKRTKWKKSRAEKYHI